jgi:valyl-tRNA synthetase
MDLVTKIRNARAEANVEPGRWIAADIYAGERREAFETVRSEISFLARIAEDRLRILPGEPVAQEQALTVVASDVVAVLPLAGMVDLEAERARLRKELAQAEGDHQRLAAQLANTAFVTKAPAAVVEGIRQKAQLASERVKVLRRRLEELGG